MEPSDYQPFPPELHDYVDGRLSAEAERDFERRLERNPALKTQADSLRAALDLLHNMPVQEPRAGFDERVIGRIREADLADRARDRIKGAVVPLWQHVAQVGIGAAAAALVFALVGAPGLFNQNEVETPQGMGGEDLRASAMSATEDDLLPALADHLARFESMRRSVMNIRAKDANLQRELVSLELRHSDLMRRNVWLAGEVADLPPARRAVYAGFLESLDVALRTMEAEVNGSFSERRAPNLAAINGALSAVRVPDGRVTEFRLSAPAADVTMARMGTETPDDVMLFAAVRRADYSHDHAGVIAAADAYLGYFGQGRFKDHVNAMAIAAHLRLDQPIDAAMRFEQRFGEYDEDLVPGQLELVQGLLTEAEFERLQRARRAIR